MAKVSQSCLYLSKSRPFKSVGAILQEINVWQGTPFFPLSK